MNSLQVAADSHWLVHAAAATILYLHIAGGTLAMLSGAAALALRKGSPGHRLAGNLFFVSMLVMAAIGAVVSPFLVSPEDGPRWFDAVAGTLAFYLVATGWATARRKAGTVGRFEVAAFLFAAAVAAAVVALGLQAAAAPTRTLGGYGATDYHVFAGLFTLAAAGDLAVVLRGGSTGVGRMVRHTWRMCFALFVALGAFFFGQQRVMPEFIQGSPLLAVPPFAALGLMVFWIVKLRTAKLLGRLRRKRSLRGQDAATAADDVASLVRSAH